MRAGKVVTLFSVIFVSSEASQLCCQDSNEVYTDCGPACGGDGCYQIDYFVECKQKCEAGCFCKCGYFKNPEGVCVPGKQCPDGVVTNTGYSSVCPGNQCCEPNTYLTESNAYLEQCPGGPQPPSDVIVRGCYCLPGYSRSFETGLCVLSDKCECPPEPVCSKPNEEVGCQPCQSCTALINRILNKRFACQYLCPKIPTGCKCSNGYVYDDSKNCISEADCLASAGLGATTLSPSGCGCNEVPGCGICDTCRFGIGESKGKSLPCPKICKVGACDCDRSKGYWRSEVTGECVTLYECYEEASVAEPPPVTCGENEIPGCKNCESCSVGLGDTKFCNESCLLDACECDKSKGYWRSSVSGKCVTLEQCRAERSESNES